MRSVPTRTRALALGGLLLLALVPAGCGSPGGGTTEAPLPRFRPEAGTVLRFRRTSEAAGTMAMRGEGGEARKMDFAFRTSMEATCRVLETTPEGNTVIECATDSALMTMSALGRTLTFDTRRPETWKSGNAGAPFPGSGKDVEALLRRRERFEISPAGAVLSSREYELLADGRSRELRPSGHAGPGTHWASGTPPGGTLVTEAGIGARVEFPLIIPFGPPGGPSLQEFEGSGSWTTTAWDAARGEVTMAMEATFPQGPEGARSVTGTGTGELVWDSALGVVRRSLMEYRATLRETGAEDGEMEISVRSEEMLVE